MCAIFSIHEELIYAPLKGCVVYLIYPTQLADASVGWVVFHSGEDMYNFCTPVFPLHM